MAEAVGQSGNESRDGLGLIATGLEGADHPQIRHWDRRNGRSRAGMNSLRPGVRVADAVGEGVAVAVGVAVGSVGVEVATVGEAVAVAVTDGVTVAVAVRVVVTVGVTVAPAVAVGVAGVLGGVGDDGEVGVGRVSRRGPVSR